MTNIKPERFFVFNIMFIFLEIRPTLFAPKQAFASDISEKALLRRLAV
jgi:hypothetical protein